MDPAVIQARVQYAEKGLAQDWPCAYWSRDDQIQAMSEGWSMNIRRDRVQCLAAFDWMEFNDDRAAQEHVLARAREGSDLHCRAMVLHVASVLKNEGK